MDYETEALLFQKPTNQQRKNFKATMFAEYSLKQNREIQIYGLLPHLVWIELEADRHVIDYNEAPLRVQIVMGKKILKQQFKFAVKRDDGSIEVINIEDEIQSSGEQSGAEKIDEKRMRDDAICEWAQIQNIKYLRITEDDLAGRGLQRANLRVMLKFMETVKNSRDPVIEEAVDLAISKMAPVQIRRILESLPTMEETFVIAHISRNLLLGNLYAPLDKRGFNGALVIDLVKS